MRTAVLLITIYDCSHKNLSALSSQHYAMLFTILEITLLVVNDAISYIRDVDMLCGVITRISYMKHAHCLKKY